MSEKSSMEEIYREYALPLYKFLYTKCHSDDLAEEMTQETFYRAVKSIKRFDGSCKLFTWLCQIAKHVWYEELEKQNRHKGSALEDDVPAEDDIEDSAVLGSEKIALFTAMQKLDAYSREVVYLRLTGELSFKEIGDILGKTENWARVTFYRAKQKLRKENENGE